MPRPCPRTVDAPIRFLGLELDDWGVVSGVFMFFILVWTPIVAVGAAVPVYIAFRVAKRGQPPGIVRHRLWGWGILRMRAVPPPPPPDGSLWSPWP